MRIITGTLKGRRLSIPKGLSVRPTSDRTKESMFSIIEARKSLQKSTVLDLFAGSGNLSFEAISRGAEKAVAVEIEFSNTELINKMTKKFDVSERIQVRCADVMDYLNTPPIPFDLVFADPPYDFPGMSLLIEQITTEGWLPKEGWLLLEHDKRHDFTQHPQCILSRAYGRTIVSIFEPADKSEPT